MRLLKAVLFLILGIYRTIVFIPSIVLSTLIGFGCSFKGDDEFVSDMLSVLLLDSTEERIKQI